MNKRRLALGLAVLSVLVVIGFVAGGRGKPDGSEVFSARVTQQSLAVWSEYEGRLEAARLTLVMSRFQGSATIIDIAPEGARVSRGDVLVRFDASPLEREVQKLERDEAAARSEYESLKNAKIPLEIRDLEIQILQARTSLQAETEYLEASRPLAAEGLVSEPELAQQKLKVDQSRTQLETLDMKLKLTRAYLHPAALNLAKAKLVGAEQDLRFAREQIENSVIRAGGEGNIVYKPLYVGGEFRTVRIGDGVYPNQPFMALPDLSELTVQVDVPEAELARVAEGRKAVIRPIAFADIKLDGSVVSVGAIAQSPPGQPAWLRSFHVVVRLESPPSDPRIRPGMTATVQILSYLNPLAVVVPRAAVLWESDRAWVRTRNGAKLERRAVRLGPSNDMFIEVLEGVKPGEVVIWP